MAPVLNLSTLIERPMITIDQTPHEIVSPDEMSLLDTQRAASLGRRLDKLTRADDLNPTMQKQLAETLDALCDIIMAPIPKDARAKLTDAQRMAVIEVFTMLSLARKTKLAGAAATSMVKAQAEAMTTETGATGDSSSPGSSGSTAATPEAG